MGDRNAENVTEAAPRSRSIKFAIPSTRDAVDAIDVGGVHSFRLASLRAAHDDEAEAEYLIALAIDPAFADARFNLAAALDDLGRADEAAPHWRVYLRLDPSSEWGGHARERLRDFS